MKTNFIDERTAGEHHTHRCVVVALDKFMSGWGKAPGKSWACWACRPEDREQVERWVRGRDELRRVRVGDPPKPSLRDHVHVYVIRDGHPALNP